MNSGWDGSLKSAVQRLAERVAAGQGDVADVYRAAALATAGLPVYCDLGSCLVLTANGEILLYRWDKPEAEVTKVVDQRWRTSAFVAASEKYAELRSLRPEKPPKAVACQACGSSGKMLGGIAVCGDCHGTGWLRPE